MSKTGTYKIINGKVEKVSDDTPRLACRVDDAFYPGEPYLEYFNGRNPVLITSKGHKKAEMNARGIRELNDEDAPLETFGKRLYSYNGQKHKSRKSRQPNKLEKRYPHLLANTNIA